MPPNSPLHRALADWRAAERRLDAAGADDPVRPELEIEIGRLRARYQALFDEVEDVAGHDAPYADLPPRRRTADPQPAHRIAR